MRVSIARALVTRPSVLLMDEPFAALDEITRTKLNDDLVALKVELGATVVFVTHSVYESVYLSDRIVVMAPRPGRIVAEVDVPAPLPRDEDFRLGPVYADGCRATSLALHRGDGLGQRPSRRERANASSISACRSSRCSARCGSGKRSSVSTTSRPSSCPRRA